ncbi:MAG TPA: RHS repeat-associated core domain-containing protein [Myxococcaceae bacterium]|nr:RHS repeat-associated core domain-containing protein [Myxococcaceae bacterium]
MRPSDGGTDTGGNPTDGGTDGGGSIGGGQISASPIDPTVPTDFGHSIEFLYSGPLAVQQLPDAGVIDKRRVAVLRGRVLDTKGTPIENVRVRVLSAPEFGFSLTREDGWYDLVVNGGGQITLVFESPGYLSVQKSITLPWRNYAHVEDVALTQLDATVTAVVSGAAFPQLARGTPVTDESGRRQASLFFPSGVHAQVSLPDGGMSDAATLHVRATEYTVGTWGPAAMPGTLPPTSQYTYAVELSADEVPTDGAQSITFDKPIALYVDNFLGFPAGTIVPVGWYDRWVGQWVPSNNGVVLSLLGNSGGSASIDLDGDGIAETDSLLEGIGITAEERRMLAQTYSSPTTIWRSPISHFTPYDLNWNVFGIPADALPPPSPDTPDGTAGEPDPECHEGSIVECENQVLGQRVSLAGTNYSLTYFSDRTAGRLDALAVDIPITGATVPASIRSVRVDIEGVGRAWSASFTSAPNQTYTFVWDGLDGYGRRPQGPQRFKITTAFEYDLKYLASTTRTVDQLTSVLNDSTIRLFARGTLESSVFGDPREIQARGTVFFPTIFWTTLGQWIAPVGDLGGWSLSVNHRYQRETDTIFRSDGARQHPDMIRAGTEVLVGEFGLNGPPPSEGAQARQIFLDTFCRILSHAVGPDGSVYFNWAPRCGLLNSQIWRVKPDGTLTRVAGVTDQILDPREFRSRYADDVDAKTTTVGAVSVMATGPDGSLYFTEFSALSTPTNSDLRVRRIRPDGRIEHIAGTQGFGDSGDYGPATQAQISTGSLTADASGNLYLGETDSSVIRRIDRTGQISHFALTGVAGLAQIGGGALGASLPSVNAIAAGPDGTLYVGSTAVPLSGPPFTGGPLFRIGIDGRISQLGPSGLEIPGETGRPCLSISDIALDQDSALYVLCTFNAGDIRRVDLSGKVTRFAGDPSTSSSAFGAPALSTDVSDAFSIASDTRGAIYFTASAHVQVIRRLTDKPAGFALGEQGVPSEDAGEIFIFDTDGRHLRTLDGLTLAITQTFGYDSNGRLISATDRSGNVTTIKRDASGAPTSIVAPFGQTTNLEVDANGFLSAVINPLQDRVSMTTRGDGLLSQFVDFRDGTHQFEYDSRGRLTRDTWPTGGFVQLSRTGGASRSQTTTVTKTSALGRVTTYSTDTNLDLQTKRVTKPDGTMTVSTTTRSGQTTTVSPDGTVTVTTLAPDPRFLMRVRRPGLRKITVPSGLSFQQTVTHSGLLPLGDLNPFGFSTLTTTRTVNGKAWVQTFDAASRAMTLTTPLGRNLSVALDSTGRVESGTAGPLPTATYRYDDRGRVLGLTRGTVATSLEYGADGLASASVDPLGKRATMTRDAAGRTTSGNLPGGLQFSFQYDPSGNLTTVTVPSGATHQFGFNSLDTLASYKPPLSGPTTLEYDLDGYLATKQFPDGSRVSASFDNGGRLVALSTPRTTARLHYAQASGRLVAVDDDQSTGSNPTGSSVGLTYDGFLVSDTSWSGAVSGTIHYTYNSNLLVASSALSGSPTISYGYDSDLLLTSLGAGSSLLTLSRNPLTGFLSGTVLGQISTSQSYDADGRLAGLTAAAGGTLLYGVSIQRDAASRTLQRTETIQGHTQSFTYTYDDAGRLVSQTTDGSASGHWEYDLNGNRTASSAPGAPSTSVAATYDQEDRLVSSGSASYSFGQNGDLQQKVDGNQTTNYAYDLSGALISVALPTGDRIDYVLDAVGRRVGRKVNGSLQQAWLYYGMRPVAELDASGSVVSRFAFGTRAHVPDFMWRAGVVYRFVCDERGSVRLVVNTATGAVAQRIDYDVWGNVTADSNPGFQPFGFAGGLWDRDTNLVRFGVRDYDPQVGRWTTKDPLRLAGGANFYAYVQNSPVDRIDPNGLFVDAAVAAAAAAEAAGAAGAGAGGAGVVSVVTPLGAGLFAFGVGWVAGSWLNGFLEEPIQAALWSLFGNDDPAPSVAGPAPQCGGGVAFHHPFPMYLGGDEDQLLELLPDDLHREYHRGLDEIAPRQWGKDWFDNLPPEVRDYFHGEFKGYTQQFDAENGTSLWDAAMREGFPQP